jgi:hypothetical protein
MTTQYRWPARLLAGYLLSSSLFCSQAGATVSEDFMRSFQSPRLLFPSDNSDYTTVNPGRYPSTLLWLFQGPFKWMPMGQKGEYAEGCQPEDLYHSMIESADSKKQAQLIAEHKNRCGKSFQSGPTWNSINSWKMMSMEFDVHHHALIHRVVFQLKGGIRVKGLLALKGDMKPRPLVIMRLGVFSNVEEFLPERYLLMQLFEQGLANVLVLENDTGADFIAYNRRVAVGGYDEGLQNMQIVKIVRNQAYPLARLISSVHLMGISLGGHGVLFASLLNEFNGKPEHRPVQSFTAFCPVVNLKDTMSKLAQPGLKGTLTDFWASLRLDGLKKKIPALENYSWIDTFKYKPVFLPTAMNYLATQFPQWPTPTGPVKVPPEMEDVRDFWKANDFWPLYRHVRSDVLVMATEADDFVVPAINFQWLQENSPSWDSHIGTVFFEHGYHCTLPIAYDWATTAAIVNARILSMDKNVRIRSRDISVDISDQVNPSQTAEFAHARMETIWNNSNEVTVKFKTQEKSFYTVILPVDELDFKFRDNLAEAERTTVERWLQQNLNAVLKVENGKVMAKLTWPRVL